MRCDIQKLSKILQKRYIFHEYFPVSLFCSEVVIMPSITIRGCCIGAGRPKVILPIVARTEDDILREARRLSALKADCIEWRCIWMTIVS